MSDTPRIEEELGPQGGKMQPLSELPEEIREQFRTQYEYLGIDPETGEVPPLALELRACLVEREAGTMINHPLVHTFYIAMSNGMFNKMLAQKRKAIDEYVQKGEYSTIFLVGLVERPYQLEWLNKWARDMPDEAYWELVGDVWTDNENIWQHCEDWREVLSSDRPGREHIMSDETDDGQESERAFFESLPEVIKVYRGTSAPDEMGSGLSWTLDRKRATFFAKRLKLAGQTPRLISGRVRKEHVLAFFDRRAEKEIVCFPEHVFDRMTRRVK